MSEDSPAVRTGRSPRQLVGLGLVVAGLLAVVVGLAVALTTHTNDYACNSVVQSCPAASPAEQAAAHRSAFYMVAGLGGAAAVAGAVVLVSDRRK